MNAIILAAGLGTRLRPLTDDRPKALVEVAGVPMLEHQIKKLRAAGFKRIVVNVHYMAQQIVDFLAEKDNFGIEILVSDESNLLLDTGGGIARAAAMLGSNEPVLVHNVDVFSSVDLAGLYRRAMDCDALLLVQERESSRMLYFGDDMRLAGWKNMKTGEKKSPFEGFCEGDYSPYAFSGIHVLGSGLMRRMPAGEAFPLIPFYLSQAGSLNIKGELFPSSGSWVDAGRVGDLGRAAEIVKNFY